MSTMVVGLRILVFNGVWVAKKSKKRVKNHRISFILIWVELRPMFMCLLSVSGIYRLIQSWLLFILATN